MANFKFLVPVSTVTIKLILIGNLHMHTTAVIAIFDIGKTNKKLFLFDEQYRIILEKAETIEETIDEDGDACEDIVKLTNWVMQSIAVVLAMNDITVKAINFSAYGASFVHLGTDGKPVSALYNYLKPFPAALQEQFYHQYGGESAFSVTTASPVLGNLNSGLQLYYLKYKKPELFKKIHCSLHLPQYMSYLLTGKYYSDITSIGCHTALWNFPGNGYHDWVYKEKIIDKLAPLFPSDQLIKATRTERSLLCGVGLHDSSAALVPYLAAFTEPFILLSTGTWCISLNPFNHTPLTAAELQQDCLCYMEYHGKPVKAARVFSGNEHEEQVKRLAVHFNTANDNYKTVVFDIDIVKKLSRRDTIERKDNVSVNIIKKSYFGERELSLFTNYSEAYHQLMIDLVTQQVISTNLVLNNCPVKKIFVDGGFGKNHLYMKLLSAAFSQIEVFASAMGAALAVHTLWNHNTSVHKIDLAHYVPAAVI
jgi:L-fuculokinase